MKMFDLFNKKRNFKMNRVSATFIPEPNKGVITVTKLNKMMREKYDIKFDFIIRMRPYKGILYEFNYSADRDKKLPTVYLPDNKEAVWHLHFKDKETAMNYCIDLYLKDEIRNEKIDEIITR